MLLAHNRFFKGLLDQIADMGHPQCVDQLKQRMKELYAFEMVRSEMVRDPLLQRLAKDYREGQE
jgi:hypothetical protein